MRLYMALGFILGLKIPQCERYNRLTCFTRDRTQSLLPENIRLIPLNYSMAIYASLNAFNTTRYH